MYMCIYVRAYSYFECLLVSISLIGEFLLLQFLTKTVLFIAHSCHFIIVPSIEISPLFMVLSSDSMIKLFTTHCKQLNTKSISSVRKVLSLEE